MDRLSLEFICALGMPPVQFVELAARLGIGGIGLAPSPITANPFGFASWDLRANPAQVAATRQALADNGVRVAVGEGFLIMPGLEVTQAEPTLDIMAELGAPIANCVVVEQDRARAADEFTALADMAAQRSMLLSVEFMPLMWPASLDEAEAFVVASGADNARLLVDAMHFYRSGATSADLARIDPARIGYVQICDVPMPATNPDYGEEARHNRLPIGEGDLPLNEFLAALPRAVTIGIEAPMVAAAGAGVCLEAALAPSIAAARRLLHALD